MTSNCHDEMHRTECDVRAYSGTAIRIRIGDESSDRHGWIAADDFKFAAA
eukprot:SAG11_NODE_25790_length_354_cov_0.603922_1_plen_49_part_10